MATIIEKTGTTVEDALKAALNELGVSEEQVEVEVLEKPSKKLFGLLGSKPAKIKVTVKEELNPEKVESIESEKIPVTEVEEKIPEVETEKVSDIEEENTFETSEEKNSVEIVDKTEIIEKAKNFLTEVLANMKVDAEIEVSESDDSIVFDLSGKNLGTLIGKHGQTLDALQYLTNLAANRNDSEDRIHFVLDVENYRERRAETLQKLAKSVADRAIRMRQDVKLEPMNRHERRVIHTALQNNDKIETRSAGEEPYRYIIVSPKRRGR